MLTPTSKGDNFWPMKIEQSLPLPLMTPDKHQLTQCTTSLVPRKHHAQHFSLFFLLSLSHADNAGYRSTHAAPIVTICLVWPCLTFSPTLIVLPIKIEELKLPPAKCHPAMEICVHHQLDFFVPATLNDDSCFQDNTRQHILIRPPLQQVFLHITNVASCLTFYCQKMLVSTMNEFLTKLTTLGISQNQNGKPPFYVS